MGAILHPHSRSLPAGRENPPKSFVRKGVVKGVVGVVDHPLALRENLAESHRE